MPNFFMSDGVFMFVVLIIVSAPYIKKKIFSDAPISNEMTVDNLQKQSIRVTYVETIKDWDKTSIKEFGAQQLKKSRKCNNIFVVKPTGNIFFNDGLIMQEVRKKKVIKGNKTSDTIWVRNGLHSTLKYDKDKNEVVLSGMNRSFMQTDCEYLLFCEELETNLYSNKKMYTEVDDMWFGCYNITKNSDEIVPVKNAYYNSTIEFYVDDESLLSGFNNAKRKLIDYYLLEK